ncbi:MAG TPA: 2Fe-2S iron-sulfur cluster-binding protein [Bacteroidales bacterium]|nr:2Fe-2S iron-sulfur cluster-binding protein [Bacteroidales bacterium]
MIRFRIDNKEYEAAEGSTIHDVASEAGMNIPVLCHTKGVPHYSSCMVCMVRDKRNGRFIPSCSAPAQEGMDIDASGPEVIAIRRRAIELLLSEHRAECEAPCRIVCPAGYNIPVMNRHIAARDFDSAVKLVAGETASSPLNCISCTAYCENACRRKKVDTPVSIRNIRLHIYGEILGRDTNAPEESVKPAKPNRRFSSKTGKLEASEFEQWLKECTKYLPREREISSIEKAYHETQSCMHCDCRSLDTCKLRELAGLMQVKDTGEKKIVNSPIMKKINPNTGMIFENAKCIKCGLCVRVCNDSNDEQSLCFINRGFVSIISEPLTAAFDDILKSQAGKAIGICPTGALGWFNGKIDS